MMLSNGKVARNMPDKKLTDKEIVKALECCARPLPHCYCDECPAGANGGCAIKTENIIDLINRLQAENERLYGDIMTYKLRWAKATAKLDTAKAEAYKEFAERLKDLKHECGCNYRKKPVFAVTEDKIDNLLKELVGEDNSEQVDK